MDCAFCLKMQIRLIFLWAIIFGYGPILRAESMPAILKRLAEMQGNVQVFCYPKNLPFTIADLPVGFSNTGYGVVKNDSGLFIFPQGTGRVYRYQTESMRWKRIDSTYFKGYNFNSLHFGIGNEIYSFGGYGFWQINGMLRQYNSISGEWNIIKTNRYIPWMLKHFGWSNFYFIDTLSGKLVVNGLGTNGLQTLKDQTDPEIGTDIFALDLKNGDWQKLGHFRDTALEMIGFLPWGILDVHGNVTDIPNNRTYKLGEQLISKLQAITYRSNAMAEVQISFCLDSTLFITRDDQDYDSLIITRADLKDLGIPVFEPVESSIIEKLSGLREYGGLFLVLASGFILGLFIKRDKSSMAKVLSKNPTEDLPKFNDLPPSIPPDQAVADIPQKTPTDEKAVTFRSSRILELLEEKERSLLEFIYRYSAEERLTTIEEINKVIGVANRSMEVQKRMRSDLIGSINQKMGLITKDKKPVISKQRSEFDKRSFEYYIRTEHMDLVARVLGSK
jgi:hypothetical protein